MENKKMTKQEEWANKIIIYCNPIAQKQNLEYYSLQSPLNIDNTDVLIVGVNPRNNGNYKSQNENENWEFINGRMTSDRLLKGNPYFNLNDTDWRFFTNLKQIEFLRQIVEDNKYTYMNYFYFSTSNAMQMRKIEGFREIVEFSKKSLADLISIIKPKLTIILGVSEGLDIISDIAVETILQQGNKRFLTLGTINNIRVYGVPHPSRNYALGVREPLSKCLEYLFQNEPQREISKEEIILKFTGDIAKMSESGNIHFNVNIERINDRLKEYSFKFSDYKGKTGIYKAICKGIGEEELDFRLDIKSGKKYIAFRSSKSDFFDLEGKDLILKEIAG
ncbi:hypothetical protein [Bacteroides reticulotermitis]|uniref:hypothetical protein n=1 Tax=Bacteroides reticulotermitis TaxID=1133319 RepID=UPI003A8AFF0B